MMSENTEASGDRSSTPLSDEEQTGKDRSYSPGSEAETRAAQADGGAPPPDEDIDADAVKVAPGTGGPDDVGDIEVDEDDINTDAMHGDDPVH